MYRAFLISLFAASSCWAQAPVDFNREIRPILANNCYFCHGPDEEERKADLRLDTFAGATKDGAIVPGKPDESELIFRVTEAADHEDLMPPTKSNKARLTSEQVATLRRWIAEGGEYQGHWAFEPIADVEPPKVEGDWVKNPIDQFIQARLEKEGLKPSREAHPNALMKRMSLDLLGLLPDPTRVGGFHAAWLQDQDLAARELAEECLNSPHYGERWGRHWLDQARYADSNGYTIDGDRIMWPYRDWVIQAINRDLPFDRFTIEQLAGDLLPEPTKAQLIATGFHRNTLINQEGGTDNEQFRNEEVVDRINTTGAVWMGLTVGCAQCHTHKFDPITHKEYYEMFAFFNHGTDVNTTGQTVEVSEGELFADEVPAELTEKFDAAKAELARLEKTKAEREKVWVQQLLTEDSASGQAEWAAVKPTKFEAEGGAALELLEDQSILAGAGAAKETYVIELPASDKPIASIRLRVLTHESLPKNGPGRAGNGNFVLSNVEFSQGDAAVGVEHVQADHSQPEYPVINTIDGNPRAGWAINIGAGSAPGMKMNADHEAHFIFGSPIPPNSGPIEVTMRHGVNDGYNVGRFAFDVSPTPPPAVRDEKLLEAAGIEPDKRTDEQKKLLTAKFAASDAEKQSARGKLDAIRREMGYGQTVKAMVMKDLDTPRETYVQIRGDFLRKDKEVGKLLPNTPATLPPLGSDAELPTRLDLANWLVRPDHPMTARVTVNRVWMRYFGQGLVETENDFGTQGSIPTHPELLDWLARWFMEDADWSMKKLHKLIVTSATYRQSSNFRPDLIEVDANNLLLARQNRLRVDAEVVRDIALSASGLLEPKIGGPSVRPPQEEGVYAFTQNNKNWKASEGADRFRRGLYIRFYRSAPYPMLQTFDTPDMQTVCTRRARSNTPLQSLMMANSEAMFEMAQGLAAELLNNFDDNDPGVRRDRARHAFLLCYARDAADEEVDSILAFQENQAKQFGEDVEAAKAVAPAEFSSDPVESAAWTAVARALMNTDEFITRE
ncbi:MAG: hypothetical protein ACI8UO_002981 [Verrucomicrobiales bacterium]|jgi:hypothetical protein